MQALLPEEQQEIDDASQGSLEARHHISKSQNNLLNIYAFIQTNPDNPAKKVNTRRYYAYATLIASITEFYLFLERPPFGPSSRTSLRWRFRHNIHARRAPYGTPPK